MRAQKHGVSCSEEQVIRLTGTVEISTHLFGTSQKKNKLTEMKRLRLMKETFLHLLLKKRRKNPAVLVIEWRTIKAIRSVAPLGDDAVTRT